MSNNLNRRNNFDVYNDEDNFFNNFFGTISKENKLMKTDIKESENEYIFMIDLPGFEKKDIKLSLDQKYLTVSAIIMPIVLSFIDFSISNSVINVGNTVYGLFFDYLLEKPISLYAILGMIIYFLFSRIANQYIKPI